MPSILNNINGVFRQTQDVLVNVTGVWRNSDSYANVNGVYRSGNSGTAIEEKDIVGFIFAYELKKDKVHPNFPDLKYNPNIPAWIRLDGDTGPSMNMNSKGVIFEYENTKPLEEGIIMYEGEMYALLTSGLIINVSETKLDPNDIRFHSDVPMIHGSFATNKIAYRNIQIWGRVSYEFNGFFMDGWNSLLSTEEFTYPNIDPALDPNYGTKNYHLINEYNITPIEARKDTFDKISQIGIARDMHTMFKNMVGSFGNLNHTIYMVTVDGVKKPFIFTIHP